LESEKIMANKTVSYESLKTPQQYIIFLLLITAAAYLTWRLGTLNPEAKVFSWILYGAEVYGVITSLLHFFMTWRLTNRSPMAAEKGLSVDIFIPTFNEPVELVRRTLLAATHVDYPHQTWLLDDGNRPEMAQLAQSLGVNYLTRETNKDAKAGNLNNALQHSKAEFVAIFDADHAPQRNFLSRTLGYFRDRDVAFVQTPQDFYNLDSYQHRWNKNGSSVWTEQSLFFRVIQRGKDYWNAAFFCGSCAIIRRSALDRIGGIATGTITEDLHTSIRIHKHGYKSVYHAESLAFGLAPGSIIPFLRQRIRWGQGAMQVWRQENILFGHGLTLAQRLNYLASIMTYFDGWQKGFFYLAPAIVLLTGALPIQANWIEFLLFFVPYYLLTFWAFEEAGRGYGQSVIIEQYNMGRFAAFAWATLGWFRKHLNFRVTQKNTPRNEEPMTFLAPQLGILLFNGLSIPVGLYLFATNHHLPVFGLLANILWATVNLSLAAAIVLFTTRRRAYARQTYRFPIPLPAKLSVRGGQVTLFATVDNISPSGCALYGPFPEMTRKGDSIKGEIYLPSGSLPFKGKLTASHVQSGGTSSHVLIGCQFQWDKQSDMDRLELFLYGSDLQWQLQSLNERGTTPVEWLSRLLANQADEKLSSPEYWNAMLYETGEQDSNHPGLVSTPTGETGTRSVITFAQPAVGDYLQIRAFTRRGHPMINVRVDSIKRLESQVGPLYLCHTSLHKPDISNQKAEEVACQYFRRAS